MSKHSERIILTSGDIIRFKTSINNDWRSVTIISKAGKSTGRFKNCYNVKDHHTTYYLNLDEVYKFEKRSNDDTSSNIEEDIREKWVTLGSPISFAGITKIYEY